MEDPHLRDAMPQGFRARRRALTAQTEALRNFARMVLLRAFLLHVPGTGPLVALLTWKKEPLDAAVLHALREEVRSMSGLRWAFEVWDHLFHASNVLLSLSPVAEAERAEPFLTTLTQAAAHLAAAQRAFTEAPAPVDDRGRRALRVIAPEDRTITVGYAEEPSDARFRVFFPNSQGGTCMWFNRSGYELRPEDAQEASVFAQHRASLADLADDAEV